ncbi:MAG: hypothetical protein ACP5NV_01450 [Candidatus Woesearchaeota archaeon]
MTNLESKINESSKELITKKMVKIICSDIYDAGKCTLKAMAYIISAPIIGQMNYDIREIFYGKREHETHLYYNSRHNYSYYELKEHITLNKFSKTIGTIGELGLGAYMIGTSEIFSNTLGAVLCLDAMVRTARDIFRQNPEGNDVSLIGIIPSSIARYFVEKCKKAKKGYTK